MHHVVIEKPYQFIPPHSGRFWPRLLQRTGLIRWYLRKKHNLVEWEVRHADRLRESIDAGHGILVTPNHCRTSDPVAMAYLAEETGSLFYAMASWHLFHQDWFTAWAIRRCGGFSVYREGIDRRAIQTAVAILESAERPLIVFPEGAVSRTNDRLHALLDGVSFMARAAAKKRQRRDGGQVVIHPVGLKYLLLIDLETAIDPILTEIGSYPSDYLVHDPTVDRLRETVERIDEDLTDRIRAYGPMKLIIDVGSAIEVSPTRDRSAETDPLMSKLESELTSLLRRLATESPAYEGRAVQFNQTSMILPT